ncbi:YggT family protein [Candidatus Parcubacteria bacterium]|nr:YggT family protein [Candidatus Parcubacteria bacterium]
MTKNKLMQVFDESYDATFNQILPIVTNREEAKDLLGILYRETWDRMTDSSYTLDTIREIFEQSKLRHGIVLQSYVLGLLEALMAFRFVLKLLGANPAAGFSTFIYGVTYPFVAPFLTVFRMTRITSGSVFEWTTLLAMFVYWLIAMAIIRLFLMSRSVSTPEAASKLNQQE